METGTALTTAPPTDALSRWRNRVIGLEYHPAGALLDHPHQWRTHPDYQLEALAGLLDDVGKAAAMLAYHSERDGGQLVRIDGHGRKDLQPDEIWPVLVTDLTDAEADELLAGLDPISSEAGGDPDKLSDLLALIHTKNDGVRRLLGDLAARHGLELPSVPSLDDLSGLYGEHDPEAFWPLIRLKVDPVTYERYSDMMAALPGETEGDKFAALLDRAATKVGHAS